MAAGALAVLLLASCALQPQHGSPQTVQRLQLLLPVTVPEGRTRVFIQHGRLVRRIDEFMPHCALEIRQLHGPPRTVPAGRYPVSRVQRVTTEVVFAGPAQRLAGLAVHAPGLRRVDDYDTSPPEVFEGYHFWLQGSAGAGLLRLSCYGARAMPAEVRPPTLRELAETLGGIGRLGAAG